MYLVRRPRDRCSKPFELSLTGRDPLSCSCAPGLASQATQGFALNRREANSCHWAGGLTAEKRLLRSDTASIVPGSRWEKLE
jgi:hypothetical protein